jgi:hypothetical protein
VGEPEGNRRLYPARAEERKKIENKQNSHEEREDTRKYKAPQIPLIRIYKCLISVISVISVISGSDRFFFIIHHSITLLCGPQIFCQNAKIRITALPSNKLQNLLYHAKMVK